MGTVAVRCSGKSCLRGVAVFENLGDKGTSCNCTVHAQTLAGSRFGKMPTETKKVSDLLGYHDLARKNHTVRILASTATQTKVSPPAGYLDTGNCFILGSDHEPHRTGDNGDNDTDNSFDRIVVTATRTPEDESNIGSAFSQLTQEQLQTEQIVDLKTALNTTPGVFALETGARGGFTTVSIRGTDPSYTLILVDGIRVNTGIFDNAAPFLAYAQTFNLDTITIVRGPYSTLYGSDAIGGVISAVTHEGSGPPTATVFGEYGTYDSIRAVIISSGVIGKIAYPLTTCVMKLPMHGLIIICARTDTRSVLMCR